MMSWQSYLGGTDLTTKKYVDYLRQAFLIQQLVKHSFKSKERVYIYIQPSNGF